MTSLYLRRLLLSSLLAPGALLAQGNSANSNGKSASDDGPDTRWTNLVAAAKPSKVKAVVSAAKGSNEQKAQIALQADESRATAASAKEFYTKFPSHANAQEARKIEAIGELRGVKDGDDVQQKKALAVAKTFRDDRSHSVGAGTEVALAMDRLALSQKIKAKLLADRPSEQEKVADAVRAELGHTPELHAYYVELTRIADMSTAKRIATNLLGWPADAKIKKEAQTIVDRDALVGKALPLTLPSTQSGPVNLAQETGAVTVLFAWAPAGGQKMLNSLPPWRSSLPPGVQFIYLALGGSAKEIETLQGAAPITGRFCHQSGAAVAPTLRALKLTGLPYVYVLNRDGKLAGYGPVHELPNLLALARH